MPPVACLGQVGGGLEPAEEAFDPTCVSSGSRRIPAAHRAPDRPGRGGGICIAAHGPRCPSRPWPERSPVRDTPCRRPPRAAWPSAAAGSSCGSRPPAPGSAEQVVTSVATTSPCWFSLTTCAMCCSRKPWRMLFAIQARIRIGFRLVRIGFQHRAAMPGALALARRRPILGLVALLRSPRLDQRAIHREVLIRQQPQLSRRRHHRREEHLRHLAGQQTAPGSC